MKISAVICTYNEERNIGRCLQSIADLADEIIIVDSFSTDETRKICESFERVRFEEKTWEGFSKTKNYANSLAKHEYILSLDADEEISEELRAELLATKSTLSGVYQFNRLTNYCGHWVHHSEWFPDWCPRLFPNSKEKRWSADEVHETLIYSEPLKSLQGLVYHYSYYTLSDHIQRIDRYSELGARDLLRRGKGSSIVKSIGRGLFRAFRIYFLKRGFLDGRAGALIAIISGFAVFLKYAKAAQNSEDEDR